MSAIVFSTDVLPEITVPFSPTRWDERIVYVQKRADKEGKRYKTSLFAVPIDGGASVRLTMGEWADRAPIVNPATNDLYFLSNRERGDQWWSLPQAGGEARRITSFTHGSFGSAAISADGRYLYTTWTPSPGPGAVPVLATVRAIDPTGEEGPPTFGPPSAKDPVWKDADATPLVRVFARPHTRTDGAGWESGGLSHVWQIDCATGGAKRITAGGYAYGALAISPDGTTIVATRMAVPLGDRDLTRNELVAINVESCAVRLLPKPDSLVDTPRFSPDGREVALVYTRGDDMWGTTNSRVLLLDLEDQTHKLLATDLDRPVGDFGLDDIAGQCFLPWAPVFWEGGIVVNCTDRAVSRLLKVERDGSYKWLTPDHLACSSAVDLGSGRLGCLQGAPDQFVEVARVDSGSVRRLSADNDAVVAKLQPQRPQRVELLSDGVLVQAWYLPPRNATGPAPAILYIHGGPHAAYGARLFFEMQWHADQGYAVMYTNPRGSQSFGEAYGGCLSPHWGDPDGRDQLAFVDWMAARPEVDGTRVAVTGGSYGGYMSLFLAATTKRFRCAAADRGLYDWANDASTGDFGHIVPELFQKPYPWDDPTAYDEYSLLRIANQVECPFLVLHGEGDLRCDKSQALALHDILMRKGVPTALLLFPEEDHGMTRGGRIDRRAERLRQLNAWFNTYLRGA